MFDAAHSKRLIVALLLLAPSLTTACSYKTDFVVINQSDQTIEVRYKVKESTVGPLVVAGAPATLRASQLKSRGSQPWEKLNPDEFAIDGESHTIIVSLEPGDALRVTSVRDYAGHESAVNYFPIDQIVIKAEGGNLALARDKVRKGFSEVSSALYTLPFK